MKSGVKRAGAHAARSQDVVDGNILEVMSLQQALGRVEQPPKGILAPGLERAGFEESGAPGHK